MNRMVFAVAACALALPAGAAAQAREQFVLAGLL